MRTYNDGFGRINGCNHKNMLYCMLLFSGVFAIINIVSFITTKDYFNLMVGIMNVGFFAFFSYELYRLKNGKTSMFMKEVVINENGKTVQVDKSEKDKKDVKRDFLKTKFKDFQKNNK